MAWNVPNHGATSTGLGDIELGIKYRSVNLDDGGLRVGIFPMAELATGSARRGLGNGRTWYRLPLWVQKSADAWTFDGGGGFIVNPAPGMVDASFGGALAQYTFDPRWTLGVELFRQNALAADQSGYTLLNMGGYLNYSQHFSLLFSAGGRWPAHGIPLRTLACTGRGRRRAERLGGWRCGTIQQLVCTLNCALRNSASVGMI